MSSRALRKNRLAPKAHRKVLAAERKELLSQVPNAVHPPTLTTRYGNGWARVAEYGQSKRRWHMRGAAMGAGPAPSGEFIRRMNVSLRSL